MNEPLSNKQRQKLIRERRAAEGIKPLTVWIPEERRSSFKRLSELACVLRDSDLNELFDKLENK